MHVRYTQACMSIDCAGEPALGCAARRRLLVTCLLPAVSQQQAAVQGAGFDLHGAMQRNAQSACNTHTWCRGDCRTSGIWYTLTSCWARLGSR